MSILHILILNSVCSCKRKDVYIKKIAQTHAIMEASLSLPQENTSKKEDLIHEINGKLLYSKIVLGTFKSRLWHQVLWTKLVATVKLENNKKDQLKDVIVCVLLEKILKL